MILSGDPCRVTKRDGRWLHRSIGVILRWCDPITQQIKIQTQTYGTKCFHLNGSAGWIGDGNGAELQLGLNKKKINHASCQVWTLIPARVTQPLGYRYYDSATKKGCRLWSGVASRIISWYIIIMLGLKLCLYIIPFVLSRAGVGILDPSNIHCLLILFKYADLGHESAPPNIPIEPFFDSMYAALTIETSKLATCLSLNFGKTVARHSW